MLWIIVISLATGSMVGLIVGFALGVLAVDIISRAEAERFWGFPTRDRTEIQGQLPPTEWQQFYGR
jgi:NhaP-type Na+/H+ or K+/H+ antiporter